MNVTGWHGLEYNAVSNSTIENCNFHDFASIDEDEEMLQLDLMKDTGTFPWETGTTVYDNTPCKDITITKCIFDNGAVGTGSHTVTTGNDHTGVIVENCKYNDMDFYCHKSENWSDAIFSNCNFTNSQAGIKQFTETTQNWNLKNCIFENINRNTSSRAVQFANIEGVVVDGCSAINIGRHSFGFDYCTNVRCSNSSVVGGDRVSFFAYRSNRVVFTNCISWDSGSGLAATEGDFTVGATTSDATNTAQVCISNCRFFKLAVKQYATDTILSGCVLSGSVDDDGSTRFVPTGNIVGGVTYP
jgi:hypothetical protein